MGRTERLYKIQRLLETGRVISGSEFLAELEVSRATFRRDLSYLRDRLGAPIEWDAEGNGYRLICPIEGHGKHALPGLWFNEQEIHGMLAGIQLFSSLEMQGLVAAQIKPLRERLEKLLGQGGYPVADIQRRIHLAPVGYRPTASPLFQVIAHCLLVRKRVHTSYLRRRDGETTEREISPQRLTYYRDNWYLDAFCHRRDDLRSFALDSVDEARMLDKLAVSLNDEVLRQECDASYGIFSGKQTQVAKLLFSPFRARWVAKEVWHPDQKGTLQPDGSYLMEVPYADDRELVMDILRQGKEVQVLEPAALQARVREEIDSMQRIYHQHPIVTEKFLG